MHTLSAFASIAFLASAFAAPGPKDKESDLYFPTKEGATRIMEMTMARRTYETKETVAKVEVKDGKYLVTVDAELPDSKHSHVLEVSSTGVRRVARDGKDLSEPAVLLRLPSKVGDVRTIDRDREKTTITFEKEEEIEVPAGKFKAMMMVSEGKSDKGTVTTTQWFAAGVGLVKAVTVNGILNDRSDYVLKSFKPGK